MTRHDTRGLPRPDTRHELDPSPGYQVLDNAMHYPFLLRLYSVQGLKMGVVWLLSSWSSQTGERRTEWSGNGSVDSTVARAM